MILEFFSLFLTINSNQRRAAIAANSANSISGFFYKIIHKATSYINLKIENRSLLEENARLKNQLYALRSDTATFRKISDTINRTKYLFLPAEIIKNSVYRQNNYLTLNVGSRHGVTTDMAVVSPEGVVGIVVDVSNNYSSVISILNKKIGLSAKVKKNGYYGTLFWDGDDYMKVTLNEIPNHVAVDVGDTIVTSGYSTIFPQGLPIGLITDYKLKGTDNFYFITVQLFADFKNIRNVYVIKNLLKDEQLKLEKFDKNEY